MPPFHSRSTGALRIAVMSSAGVSESTTPPCPAPRATCGLSGIDLAARGNTPPPGEISDGRSRPTTTGAGRTAARARRTRPPGPGSGSRKTCRWSNAATSRMCSRQQHPVAEHVAAHVADADDREVLVWMSTPSSRKCRLTRLPGPARGDAHRLVVVARRAAGGERVAQPEAVVGRDAVGDVGERGRALVGGDDEIGVVAVVADHPRRGHDLARPTRLSVRSSRPRMRVR